MKRFVVFFFSFARFLPVYFIIFFFFLQYENVHTFTTTTKNTEGQMYKIVFLGSRKGDKYNGFIVQFV